MQNAKDPDEFVLKFGPERFLKLMDNSLSLVEYKIKILQKEYNLEDISDKIKFLSKLSYILSKVDSNIERDIYVDKFSRELNVGKEAIIAEIEKNIFKNLNVHFSYLHDWFFRKKIIVENSFSQAAPFS